MEKLEKSVKIVRFCKKKLLYFRTKMNGFRIFIDGFQFCTYGGGHNHVLRRCCFKFLLNINFTISIAPLTPLNKGVLQVDRQPDTAPL